MTSLYEPAADSGRLLSGPSAAAVLQGLRDINGVHGSLLVGPGGTLLSRDLPSLFTDDLLLDLSPRLLRLLDAFSVDGADGLSCVTRFRDHLLLLRAVRRGALAVLASLDVNMPALKMGVNLAVRRLAATPSSYDLPIPPPLPDPARRSSSTLPALGAAGPAPTAPLAPAASATAASSTIQYRGTSLPKLR